MATKLTAEQLQQTPEFLALNPRQRAFILEFITDGDSAQAAHVAYPAHKNPAVAGLTLIGRQKMQVCLGKFFGIDPLESIVHDIQKILQSHLRRNGKARGKKIDPQLNQLLRNYLRLGGTLQGLRLKGKGA